MAALMVAVLAGCGGGSASGSDGPLVLGLAECRPVGNLADADREVDLQLTEWTIEGATTVAAGRIGFAAKSIGKENHELLILRVASVADLPRTELGSLDATRLDDDAVAGRIGAFRPGQTCTGVFDLEPGDYVLMCNLVEPEVDRTIEVHLAEGQAVSFTVTA
jgi:hypothetical protein